MTQTNAQQRELWAADGVHGELYVREVMNETAWLATARR